MEQSPLTQQSRPDIFEPKIVQLYRQLFRNPDDDEQLPGFWSELFLLKPDVARLGGLIEDTDATFLLQTQHHSQQLLSHGIAAVKRGIAPSDEHALEVRRFAIDEPFSAHYLDIGSLSEQSPGEKIPKPEFRHYRSSRWSGQCRFCNDRSCRHS